MTTREDKKAPEALSEGIFGGAREPSPEAVWELYDRGRKFKEAIDLYETVNTNENFFIGKQWEGVQANGLPTPVFNILKRDVCFVVSSITTDNLKVQATPLAASAGTGSLSEPARILNEEFESIFEHNHVTNLLREFARDAAVRGDGCIYTYWDPDVPCRGSRFTSPPRGRDGSGAGFAPRLPTEQGSAGAPDWAGPEGAIKSEIIQNTRVHFGNPNDRRVQEQPYIIVESREIARILRRRARERGSEDWDAIVPDEDSTYPGAERRTDDKVTKLFLMWKDEENGEVWGYECTRNAQVRGPWRMGIRLYPLVWLNWDYVQDCCHGQAMLTGLIPNQIFINKMWAMSMLSLMTTAYPKIVYDKTRIPKWTNQIGQAIGITGGDVATAARAIDPAAISPQVSQFIEAAITQTNANLGATSVALGDTRPDNTSAIIALQRAAATPSEITKQNLRRCVEELARVYLEFIAGFYGVREVDVPVPEELRAALEAAGLEAPTERAAEFDFGVFRDMPMALKIDVGASAYYSEIASIETLDNLLSQGRIDIIQYLERIPDGYVTDRRGLIEEIKRKRRRDEINGKQQ